MLPVNPAAAGQTILGQTCVASLGDLRGQPDILDIFRRPDAVPAIVEEGLRLFPKLRCVWLQIGIVSDDAADLCARAGVPLVQNRCPKIEHQRLFGELRKAGFATGVISSRRPSIKGP